MNTTNKEESATYRMLRRKKYKLFWVSIRKGNSPANSSLIPKSSKQKNTIVQKSLIDLDLMQFYYKDRAFRFCFKKESYF